MTDDEIRAEFEVWLRTVCFQKPTPEAYDLAKDAYLAAARKYADRIAELEAEITQLRSISITFGRNEQLERDSRSLVDAIMAYQYPSYGEARPLPGIAPAANRLVNTLAIKESE